MVLLTEFDHMVLILMIVDDNRVLYSTVKAN